jgi:hypothetical protein
MNLIVTVCIVLDLKDCVSANVVQPIKSEYLNKMYKPIHATISK